MCWLVDLGVVCELIDFKNKGETTPGESVVFVCCASRWSMLTSDLFVETFDTTVCALRSPSSEAEPSHFISPLPCLCTRYCIPSIYLPAKQQRVSHKMCAKVLRLIVNARLVQLLLFIDIIVAHK